MDIEVLEYMGWSDLY